MNFQIFISYGIFLWDYGVEYAVRTEEGVIDSLSNLKLYPFKFSCGNDLELV
jgi:hypothetical protein